MKSVCCLFALALSLAAQSGSLSIHMILHPIGQENYEFTRTDDSVTLNTKFEYTDRGNQRSTTALLRMKPDYTPLSLEVKPRLSTVVIRDSTATVTEDAAIR